MNKGLRQWRQRATSARAARLFDRFGRRWALRVVWELRGGPLTFRGLQAACGGVSPSVLQQRLRELAEADVVEKVPRLGYRLSAAGEGLCQALEPVAGWADTNLPAEDS